MKKIPNPVDITVGQRVRAARANAGISQETLGAALGITFQQIQKYEKGTNRISASRMHAMAAELGVKPSYFLDNLDAAPASDNDIQATIERFIASGNSVEICKLWPAVVEKGNAPALLHLIRLAAQVRL